MSTLLSGALWSAGPVQVHTVRLGQNEVRCATGNLTSVTSIAVPVECLDLAAIKPSANRLRLCSAG